MLVVLQYVAALTVMSFKMQAFKNDFDVLR